jgi:hypothetical protein
MNAEPDKRLPLPSVTLIAVTSVDIEKALFALSFSSEKIEYASIKLLSPFRPKNLRSSIEHIHIPNISFRGYSKFVIENLYEYVETPFCLLVQADGFVINPTLWNDSFLQYDYIGAPWPERVRLRSEKWFHLDKNRVGNGGFSLRSSKLLKLTSRIDFDRLDFPLRSEDLIICHFLYDRMIADGVKFAPVSVAAKFSLESAIAESPCSLDETFGFHGRRLLNSDRLQQITKDYSV